MIRKTLDNIVMSAFIAGALAIAALPNEAYATAQFPSASHSPTNTVRVFNSGRQKPKMKPEDRKMNYYMSRFQKILQDVDSRRYDHVERDLRSLVRNMEYDLQHGRITNTNAVEDLKNFAYQREVYNPEPKHPIKVKDGYEESILVPPTYIKGAGPISPIKVVGGIIGSCADVALDVVTAGRSTTAIGPESLRDRQTVKVADAHYEKRVHPTVYMVETLLPRYELVKITPYYGKSEVLSTRPAK